MQSIRDSATRLTDQLQVVVGYLELSEHAKALHSARHAIQTLHFMCTAIALEAARFDSVAAEVRELTSRLAAGTICPRKPPKPS